MLIATNQHNQLIHHRRSDKEVMSWRETPINENISSWCVTWGNRVTATLPKWERFMAAWKQNVWRTNNNKKNPFMLHASWRSQKISWWNNEVKLWCTFLSQMGLSVWNRNKGVSPHDYAIPSTNAFIDQRLNEESYGRTWNINEREYLFLVRDPR